MILSLGIDFGTSGIRAVVMDKQQHIVAQAQNVLPESQGFVSSQNIIGYSQVPDEWWQTFVTVTAQLSSTLGQHTSFTLKDISHLAIDGTSGTVLFTDKEGTAQTDALMYNDQRAIPQAKKIETIAPSETAAIGVTSGLAKLLWLYENNRNKEALKHALNQSDWICGNLLGQYGFSDHNNALKMGYDAINHTWPDWLQQLFKNENLPISVLPEVFMPGEVIGSISDNIADQLGFSKHLKICAGTTDSTAAIIASGVKEVGEAITSLGSSMVMKVISNQPVFNQQYGVYSQPYGDLWLVGGSSNSGGSVLKSYFCPGEISDYTDNLNSGIDNGQFSLLNLSYYPLMAPGERFPIQDPQYLPKLTPRPQEDQNFFQAMLEGMADIETLSYQRLLELGAPYPKRVTSIGGGSFNRAWRHIRQLKLQVPVVLAQQEQAAAGAALLAQRTWIKK